MERLVDEGVVDVGVAELDGALEELGDQHVLALGRELDEPVRPGARHARLAEDAQRVVLLLHQPAHRVERLLVLQPSVQQLATELVPAVRPQVGARVELAEQVRRRRAVHLQAQRRRAGRLAQPERSDLGDGEAELLGDRLANRFAPRAADVEVRGPPPAVRHREHLARREVAEAGHREADADEDADDDRARGDRRRGAGGPARPRSDEDRDRPLQSIAQVPLGDQRVQGHDRQPGEGEHLDRRHRPAAPAPSQGDAERARLGRRVVQEVDGDLRHLRHDQVDHQVAPPAEDDQREGEHPDGDLDHPPRAGVADPPGDAMDPGKVDVAHPPHDRVVDDHRRDRRARDTVAVDQHGQDHRDDGADQPAGPGPAQVPGQRRWGTRRAASRARRPARPTGPRSTIGVDAAIVDCPTIRRTSSLTGRPGGPMSKVADRPRDSVPGAAFRAVRLIARRGLAPSGIRSDVVASFEQLEAEPAGQDRQPVRRQAVAEHGRHGDRPVHADAP